MANTNTLNMLVEALKPMKNSGLSNYIVPGLTSYLVGGKDHGKVRVFAATRNDMNFITPHSHRFDFTSFVLKGRVRNTLYRECPAELESAELWVKSSINQVCGLDGICKYIHDREERPTSLYAHTTEYGPGETYKMDCTEIHSIQFTKGAIVLFFEGPQKKATGTMLEPWINGKVVPTFKTEDWMFQKIIDNDYFGGL